MKIRFCIAALIPLIFPACMVEQPVPVTTTTREVTTTTTTTGPVATREVVVTQAPPVLRTETQTVSPGPQYVWQRGYWRWNGVRYVWVPGRWVVGPRLGAVWVPGQWIQRPGGGFVYEEGHWQ